MAQAKLEIQSNGPTLWQSKVLIDGQEISALTALNLRMNMVDATLVTLTLSVDEVKIDTDTLVKLEAHLDREQRAAIVNKKEYATFEEARGY